MVGNRTSAASAVSVRSNWTGAVPSHIAVGYHGHFRRIGSRQANSQQLWSCSDYFVVEANHQRFIYAPLRAAGVSASTFVHTFKIDACGWLDRWLVRRLAPVAYELAGEHELTSPRIADSALRVLQLILRHYEHGTRRGAVAGARAAPYAGALLVRFDAVYRTPVTALPIDWAAVNLAFRAEEAPWQAARMTSDLFFALPVSLGLALVSALAFSASRTIIGHAHLVYDELVSHVGARRVAFLEPAAHSASNLEAPRFGGHFLALCRSCAWIATDPGGWMLEQRCGNWSQRAVWARGTGNEEHLRRRHDLEWALQRLDRRPCLPG